MLDLSKPTDASVPMQTLDKQSLREHLLISVLPALFENPSSLGTYGSVLGKDVASRMQEVQSGLQSLQSAGLDGAISELICGVRDANPANLKRRWSWLDRFLGRDVELEVRYVVSASRIDTLAAQVASVGDRVREMHHAISEQLAQLRREIPRLSVFIEAGQAYLGDHPDAGASGDAPGVFSDTRARFERRLDSLRSVLLSHEMAIAQIALVLSQSLDLLDRFDEVREVMLPAWQHQRLALDSAPGDANGAFAEALATHDQILASLKPGAPRTSPQ